MVNAGYELADLESDALGERVSLFDYLTGLGKVLAARAPLLFSQGDPEDVQSIAFSLVTLILGRRLEDMSKLPDFLRDERDASLPLDLSSVETATRWGAEFVEGLLRPFLELKLNSSQPGKGVHSELQVVSMIASAVANRYEAATWGERTDWKARREQLAVALPQHYVFDIVRREWRGGLYSLAFSRTWKEATTSTERAMLPASHYLTPISRGQFDEQLGIWWIDELGREQRDRSRMSPADRLLLKVVYSHTLTFAQHAEYEFEIDHLFPVKRLKDLIARSDDRGWPMGAIGNLALLRKDLNKRKREETVPEFLSRVDASSDVELDNSAEMVREASFVDSDSLAIPQVDGRDSMTRDNYVNVIETRWTAMRSRLLDALKVSNNHDE
jgi:hypothetical protein